MLACLEEQVNRANETKQSNIAHQKQIEQKVYLLMNTAILQLLSHIFENEFVSSYDRTKPLISIY